MTQTDTRRRVLDVAPECFLADGYEQTTIARIRARSGTSNGALFHHFPSKEAIAGALYVEAIASFQAGLWDLVSRRPRSLREAVRGAISHQLTWTEQNADLARFVYTRGHLDWNSAAGAELAARPCSARDLERHPARSGSRIAPGIRDPGQPTIHCMV